jgi:hypothetical protein
MEELFIVVFIPRLLFFQGDNLSLLALPCSQTNTKLKSISREVRYVDPNDVCIAYEL